MCNTALFLILVLLHDVYLLIAIPMKRIDLLLAAALLLTSCATSTPAPTPMLPPTAETPRTLPEPTDPTQLITVKTGETFDLVVPSNSSTGYRWNIVPELDETIVQFVAQDSISEQPVMPGSGGVDVWTFQAVNPGTRRLSLDIIHLPMRTTLTKWSRSRFMSNNFVRRDPDSIANASLTERGFFYGG